MILVTGATGFVGSYLLVHLLEYEEQVRALYRDKTGINHTYALFNALDKLSAFEKIQWVMADITDIPALEHAFSDVTHVYHCAAKVSFDPADEAALRKANIEGTANIVNMCLTKGVRKLCYASSIAALGDLRNGESVITEESEWNPEQYHSDYAISKYGAEMEVWRGQQEGLDTVIVNPGLIIGYWPQTTGTMQIFKTVAAGLKWKTFGSTGFVSVQDVVKIMRLLMLSDITAQRFALVSENIRYDTLAEMIAQCLNVPVPQKPAPQWLTGLLYRLDWIASALFQTRRRLPRSIAESLHASEAYSGDRIKQSLEIEFIPVADAVAATCRALRLNA